jgi:protein-tyrosine phosphatase
VEPVQTIPSATPSLYNPSEELYKYLIELDMFSRLPPQTYVHNSKLKGHFIPTGGDYSAIPGVSTISNWWNERTVDKLATAIENFCSKINIAVSRIFSQGFNTSDKQLTFFKYNEFLFAYNAIQEGLNGLEPNGGMVGLIQTYEWDPDHQRIDVAIKTLKNSISNQLATIHNWTDEKGINPFVRINELPYCPEEYFTDEQWKATCETSTLFITEHTPLSKYWINFSGNLAVNQLAAECGKFNYWDSIIEYENGAAIYLGQIPTEGIYSNHAESLKGLGIGAILSFVELFEVHAEGKICSSIPPEMWKNLKIRQLIIPVVDFDTMSLQKLQRGIAYLKWCVQNKLKVYVHCKAGKSRSGLGVMAYLIDQENHTSETAFDLVRSKRPAAGFDKNSSKMATLLEFERLRKLGK